MTSDAGVGDWCLADAVGTLDNVKKGCALGAGILLSDPPRSDANTSRGGVLLAASVRRHQEAKPTIRRSGDTVSFVLGRGIIIRGLDEGIRGMRLGGVRQLVIPATAGFGREGRLNVPPNAVLVAEAKLLSAAYDPTRPATLECPSPALAGTDSVVGSRRDSASIGCRGYRYQTIRIF